MNRHAVPGKWTELDTYFPCRIVDSAVSMDSRLSTATDES